MIDRTTPFLKNSALFSVRTNGHSANGSVRNRGSRYSLGGSDNLEGQQMKSLMAGDGRLIIEEYHTTVRLDPGIAADKLIGKMVLSDLIAERIMGWKRSLLERQGGLLVPAWKTDETRELPLDRCGFNPYETIAWAWKVVLAMEEKHGWALSFLGQIESGHWGCAFSRGVDIAARTRCSSAPRAISLAAARAFGIRITESQLV